MGWKSAIRVLDEILDNGGLTKELRERAQSEVDKYMEGNDGKGF